MKIEILTLDEVAADAGKTRTAILHHALRGRLEYMEIGGRYLFERGAWERFKASHTWTNRGPKTKGDK